MISSKAKQTKNSFASQFLFLPTGKQNEANRDICGKEQVKKSQDGLPASDAILTFLIYPSIYLKMKTGMINHVLANRPAVLFMCKYYWTESELVLQRLLTSCWCWVVFIIQLFYHLTISSGKLASCSAFEHLTQMFKEALQKTDLNNIPFCPQSRHWCSSIFINICLLFSINSLFSLAHFPLKIAWINLSSPTFWDILRNA